MVYTKGESTSGQVHFNVPYSAILQLGLVQLHIMLMETRGCKQRSMLFIWEGCLEYLIEWT